MTSLKSDETLCPICAETIKSAAKKCKHCGQEFTLEEIEARQQQGFDSSVNKMVGCAAIAAIVLLVATCSSFGDDDDPSSVTPDQATLSSEVVAQCRELLEIGQRNGIIRGRPQANRINVEDALWMQLDAETKDRTLQAVACDVWQTAMPPSGEHVVVYGHRSGKRVQMLTSVGMVRE